MNHHVDYIVFQAGLITLGLFTVFAMEALQHFLNFLNAP
ncbi:hypothetical protein vBPpSSYP_5 [Pseudomonas phage vB_PpS_SYP]|nr:hypothetical protein vBPpSSYP_5 [Pseudomonas phage vB_PpS_SYP]